MKSWHLQKVDVNLYIQGLSGPLVFLALYGIIAAFLLFVGMYILLGTFPAVMCVVPSFFAWLYRIKQIQKTLGPDGWNKKKTARKLPEFILMKKRFCQTKPL